MNALVKHIQMVEHAIEEAEDAQSVWTAFVDAAQNIDARLVADVKDAAEHLAAFIRRTRPLLVRLKDMDKARRARFAAVPVLQAKLAFADGTERRVAVSKPTDDIDEPYIGEMFYAALVRQGVVGSCESFPVLVIDRRRRVIAKIGVLPQ